MSSRHDSEVRAIHPKALRELGEEACIVALGVARDLRSGVIESKQFHMRYLYPRDSRCGSACCIAGWMMLRGISHGLLSNAHVGDLFLYSKPSDPKRAADAIERFVYDGSKTPWKT